jgi:Tol biopolymer transport system component
MPAPPAREPARHQDAPDTVDAIGPLHVSPDGRWIAYESRAQGPSKIWVADPDTGTARQVTTGSADDILPAWSRDGRSIYFASTMSGPYQIWTVPATGGTPVQITQKGGSCAAESPDSKTIYYTAGGYPAVLRKTSIHGHEESDVAEGVPGICCFAIVPEGVFYLSAPTADGGGAGLRFLRFAPGAMPPQVSFTADVHRFLSSSADGRFLFYSQTDRRESDLMAIDKPF